MDPRDRRQSERLDVLGRIESFLVTDERPVVLREISSGGFSVESDSPFLAGETHEFRFSPDPHVTVTLAATVMHCGLASAPGAAAARYVTGFSFVRAPGDRQGTGIDALVRRLRHADAR